MRVDRPYIRALIQSTFEWKFGTFFNSKFNPKTSTLKLASNSWKFTVKAIKIQLKSNETFKKCKTTVSNNLHPKILFRPMHLKSTAGKPKLPPSQNYQNSKNIYFAYEIPESPISLLIKWLLECMYPISKLSQMNIIQFKVNIPSFLCLFFLFFNYFSLMLFFVFLRINFVGKKQNQHTFERVKKSLITMKCFLNESIKPN